MSRAPFHPTAADINKRVTYSYSPHPNYSFKYHEDGTILGVHDDMVDVLLDGSHLVTLHYEEGLRWFDPNEPAAFLNEQE